MQDSQPPQDLTASGPDSRTLKRVGIGAGVIALAVVAIGATTRIGATNDLRDTAQKAAIPSVAIVSPQSDAKGGALVLPGNVQAYNSAAIYARTNGYVSRWLADIGDNVRAGQSLAVLDAPEIDQQLAAAQADYQTALAQQRLADTTAKRWAVMLAKDAVSKQESDEKNGDLAARSAVTNAALANVKRLRALQGFTRLAAPFDGVVTSRSAQIGALVVAGNAASQPLFTVSDIHRMRIYVRVPQGYSSQVKVGMPAALTLPEFPGRSFTATMTRSAGAVDAQSGAVLVELQAANPDRALKPGAFAQVRFDVGQGSGNGLSLPGSAILYGNDGPTVAVVGRDSRVTVRPISIARDEGATVLVASGIRPGERVIDSPPDSIQSGDKVSVQSGGKGAAHAS
ncbi:efflux RND transporter periplasmic adaptor subunit [Sphingobium cupriresistens]|uniref:RND transporter n=2 Tax=Sphingobium cupriresistens TaxID=1132417 RepID=A0A0J7XMD4_9SPHN|nr:efflux RND transporter periplasmic adaptor subunit [Sphingobium cupriresistens]KMS53106.1 RND transporter [Sphingobium cupriresistens LL01]RYM13775.1 efflux RND transporter periplasmic adaptor subunit [Sphingobium cupriresistens]